MQQLKMKTLFPAAGLFAVLLFHTQCSFDTLTQPLPQLNVAAPDLSAVPDSVQNRYEFDAAAITVQAMITNPENYQKIEPDAHYQENLFNALLHVYQARHIPQRDNVMGIHSHPQKSLTDVLITYSPEAPWTQAWRESTALSGDAVMDDLVTNLGISIHIYYQWEPDEGAVLRCSRPVNTVALSRLMRDYDHVSDCRPVETANQQATIAAKIKEGAWHIRYYQAAVSGKRSGWEFRVEADGQVYFISTITAQ